MGMQIESVGEQKESLGMSCENVNTQRESVQACRMRV